MEAVISGRTQKTKENHDKIMSLWKQWMSIDGSGRTAVYDKIAFEMRMDRNSIGKIVRKYEKENSDGKVQ